MLPMLAALRTTLIGKRARREGLSTPASAAPAGRASERRRVWFAGEWIDTPILLREALCPGDTITGPAIVEQLDTTTIVEPGDPAVIDAQGNLIITLRA